MLTFAWACKPSVSVSDVAADIADALDTNDIALAKQRANALDGKINEREAPISDLCGLSVELMRLSQTDDDNEYAAQALQYYESAVSRDSVAASRYFDKLPSEKFACLQMLRQLRRQSITRQNGVTISEEYGGE